MTALWACVWRGGSFQHPFQFFHAHGDFLFQRGEVLQDFARRAVRDFCVDDFLVAVEREVVALRSVLCALDEPKSTPSGTMTAARPPGLSNRRKSARKSSSVFFVFTICRRSLAQFSS